jgi:general stress protein 26
MDEERQPVVYDVHSKRPIWWSRHDIRPFTLSDEEAWQLITSPPWRCVIAWVTRENHPVIAPMAYQVLDGKIMLTTTKNRDKVKALRRNPAISVCFQNAEGTKHVTVRGYVEFSEDPELVRRWITSFVESYGRDLSWEEKQLEIARYGSPDRLILIVHVEKMRTFDREKMIRAEKENQDVWGSETASS